MSIYISKYANGEAVDAALDKAESAVQPEDLGTAASQNVEAFEPADATILKDADIGTTVCAQTDPRLSDARTPTSHKASHATGGSDALTPADIGAATAAQGALADTALQPADVQTDAADRTEGRIARIDLVPMDRFTEVCHIAGMAPTLYLDFEHQDYRIYSAANGLERKALTDIVTTTRATDAGYYDALGVYRFPDNDNLPRLDFDPSTGLCRGLLVEEARTNVFLNALADGTSLSTQTITVTAAPWTISFYGSGSITLSGAHTATMTGTDDTTRTVLTFTPAAGSLVCTVNGTVKRAQAELGEFATSFIATAGAAAQRNADVIKIDGAAFAGIWNPSEMTMAVVARAYSNTVQNTFLSATDGSDYIRILGFQDGASGVPSSTAGVLIYGTYLSNATTNYVAGLKANDFVGYTDGVLTGTGSSGTIPSADHLLIGATFDSPVVPMNGYVPRVILFPRKLTNTQLQQLSALGA